MDEIFMYTPPGVRTSDRDAAPAGLDVGATDACCCPAKPVVRVVMPPTPARPHETELFLCGHHYRVSREALASARAMVSLLPGPADSPLTALVPDLPRPRVHAG